MLSKFKHSKYYKWVVYIWLTMFIGFSYIQYSNLHSHILSGRLIMHSHVLNKYNSTDSGTLPVNSQNDKHNHTKDEFFFYSLVYTILAAILIAVIFLLFLNHDNKFILVLSENSSQQFIFSYKALRAPPVIL